MTRNIGLWIDHREAVIIFHEQGGQRTEIVESNLEKPAKQAGGSRSSTPWGPQDIASDKKRDRKFHHQLDQYYNEVIGHLSGADSLYIFGPGEAKNELRKHLLNTHILRDRIAEVETADKMTRPQIAAKVRDFFPE